MLAWLAVALALELGVAMAFYLALDLGARMRSTLVVGASVIVLSTPLVVPAESPVLRLIAAIAAALVCLKLVDVHVGAARGSRPRLGPYVEFLINPFCFVQRRMDRCGNEPRGRIWRRLGLSAAGLLCAYVLLSTTSRISWPAFPFLFDHVAKSSLFFIGVVAMFTLGATLVQIGGGVAPAPVAGLLSTSSPADFWRRYNRCLRLFFHQDVFYFAGSWRSPLRATFLVFAISGLLHEYAFSLAAGRLQGYQSLFFMLQASAVAVTLRARPSGGVRVLTVVATLFFLLATSVLFFLSLDEIVPFYSYPPAL